MARFGFGFLIPDRYSETGSFYTKTGSFYTKIRTFYTENGTFYTKIRSFYTKDGTKLAVTCCKQRKAQNPVEKSKLFLFGNTKKGPAGLSTERDPSVGTEVKLVEHDIEDRSCYRTEYRIFTTRVSAVALAAVIAVLVAAAETFAEVIVIIL